MWEEHRYARFLSRLASFSRLILFDKRGSGASDSVPLGALPTLQEWSDDIRTVMDAVGSQRAAILGVGVGGWMAALFAALYPERTVALILFGTPERGLRLPFIDEDTVTAFEAIWGRPAVANAVAPGEGPAFANWLAKFCRLGGPPKQASATLVPSGKQTSLQYFPLSGSQPSLCNAPKIRLSQSKRDGSWLRTSRARTAWSFRAERLSHSSEMPTRCFARSRHFSLAGTRQSMWTECSGPARAIRCAAAIVGSARSLGLDVRAGLHTGECEVRGEDIAGIAVHIGARIGALAGPGEVLATYTVLDLLAETGSVIAERVQFGFMVG